MSVNMTVVSTRSVTGVGLELLHFIQQGVLVPGEGLEVSARQVHESGVRDVVGEVAAVFWILDFVVCAIQDQRGSLDRRKHGPDVDVPLELPYLTDGLEA